LRPAQRRQKKGHNMTSATRAADDGAPAEPGGPDASGVHLTEGERRESGIAPARERLTSEVTLTARGDELVQLALAESARTEANLNVLLRGLQHLTTGAAAALEANTQMACELDAVRNLLGKGHVEELALRQRVRLLEHTLETVRREVARERALFIEQEDLFLEQLLGDHEREIARLEERLARVAAHEPELDARATIRPEPLEPTPLGAIALRTVRIPRPIPAPVPDTLQPSPQRAGGAAPALPAAADTLPPSSATSETERPPARASGAPASGTRTPAAATDTPVADASPRSGEHPSEEAMLLTRPTSRPPPLQKPGLSTRPLVGYSLGSGDVAEEHLGRSPRKPEG